MDSLLDDGSGRNAAENDGAPDYSDDEAMPRRGSRSIEDRRAANDAGFLPLPRWIARLPNGAVLGDSGGRLGAHHKVLLAALSWFAAMREGEARPGMKRLAREIGCSPTSVRRVLAQLVEAGLLERSYRRGATNTYRIQRPDREWTRVSSKSALRRGRSESVRVPGSALQSESVLVPASALRPTESVGGATSGRCESVHGRQVDQETSRLRASALVPSASRAGSSYEAVPHTDALPASIGLPPDEAVPEPDATLHATPHVPAAVPTSLQGRSLPGLGTSCSRIAGAPARPRSQGIADAHAQGASLPACGSRAT